MTDTGNSSGPQITNAPEKNRYEIREGDVQAGIAQYRLPDDSHVDFIHTEVSDEFEGRGLASKLIRFALDDVRSSGKRIIAHCPYVAGWIKRHDGYADITDWP